MMLLLVACFAPNCRSFSSVAAAWPESMASAPMATPCFQIAGEACGYQHGGGVEQNDVAARAGMPVSTS